MESNATQNVEKALKTFLTSAPYAVWAMEMIEPFTEKPMNIRIVKLSSESGEVIPFCHFQYRDRVFEGKIFDTLHAKVGGLYLVQEDFFVFEDQYTAKNYLPVLPAHKTGILKDLIHELDTTVLSWLKAQVKAKQPEAGAALLAKGEAENLLAWYREGESAIDYLLRRVSFVSEIQENYMYYIRQHLGGYGVVDELIEKKKKESRETEVDITLLAGQLNTIEKQYQEFDRSPVIQREKEVIHLLRHELKEAVTVNAVLHDGTTVKVANRIYQNRDQVEIGVNGKVVKARDIQHVTYKRKIYGETLINS